MSTLNDQLPPAAIPYAVAVDAAPRTAAGRSGPSARALAWELIQTVVMTVAIFLVVRGLVQNFRVEGASMEPTFATGQYLLINKAAYFRVDGTPLANFLPSTHQGSIDYLFGGPSRGDIVVFKAPPQPDKDFIKRVIGLPGDTILVRSGLVFVNGEKLTEPYLEFHATYNYPVDGQPKKLGPNEYFVLGDNRPNSSDSHLGWTVPVDNIIGSAWVRYWPPPDWGVVPHESYALAANP